jgi:uroporphyrin-III C-methyltransferase
MTVSDATGSITLIGGGPGDIDLLTLRAVERLRAAEVILYDDLAGDELLTFANPEAELIAVGKRAGHPSPKQQEVSRLMIGYAQLGKRVVRV